MRPTITSLQNPRVKNAARLRERRGRAKQGRIIIDGFRELLRALDAGADLLDVFVCLELCAADQRQQILARIESTGLLCTPVTPAVFSKLSFGEREEGVVAVARTPRRTLRDLQLAPDALVAVVEGIEKPGNLGAVIRTADGAGVSALVLTDGGTDLYNPNVIRSSLGAVFTLPVCAASGRETLDWLRATQTNIFGAQVEAAVNYTDVSYRGRTAIVFGSEAGGLSRLWRGDDIAPISLPMCGAVDSLNVSAAAAVLFYEALRQRTPSARGPARG